MSGRIYFDNAASTPLLPMAQAAMLPYLAATGNPSSIHQEGQWLRVGLEKARRTVATCLNIPPSTLYFTGSATEANNWALHMAAEAWGVRHILSTGLEHPSVLRLLQRQHAEKKLQHYLLPTQPNGQLILHELSALLDKIKAADPEGAILLSIMHANNEVGTWYDLAEVVALCKPYGVRVHSDMVQTVGHIATDLTALGVDMASFSGHKFHGPKGIGGLYVAAGHPTAGWLLGGTQERQLRAGTENVAAAVGMSEALTYMTTHTVAHQTHGLQLKKAFLTGLSGLFPTIQYNGGSDTEQSAWHILHCTLPIQMDAQTLLMSLDMQGVAASMGNACASGALLRSDVLEILVPSGVQPSIRFSFSFQNTLDEVQRCLAVLQDIATISVKS